jgi:hypothetical protein
MCASLVAVGRRQAGKTGFVNNVIFRAFDAQGVSVWAFCLGARADASYFPSTATTHILGLKLYHHLQRASWKGKR